MGDTRKSKFRVGTRKSELAIIQTNHVIEKLQVAYPGTHEFTLITMDTIGDKILDKPLSKIGEKSLFTQELEQALDKGEIDFVVHSLKDLPTILPEGKVIGAVLKREDPSDCVILHEKHKNISIKALPTECVIGTSSLRRTAQIRSKYPQVKIENIRGNINTRLRKLNDGLFDGIVVAVAGMKRMNWMDKINEILDRKDFLYAVGQGALAVECQAENTEVLSLLETLADCETTLAVIAERSFLRKLEGGCSAPVAVNCSLRDNKITLTGLVSSLNGSQSMHETKQRTLISGNEKSVKNISGEPAMKRIRKPPSTFCGIISNFNIGSSELQTAEELGQDLATSMISKGALTIMEEARKKI